MATQTYGDSPGVRCCLYCPWRRDLLSLLKGANAWETYLRQLENDPGMSAHIRNQEIMATLKPGAPPGRQLSLSCTYKCFRWQMSDITKPKSHLYSSHYTSWQSQNQNKDLWLQSCDISVTSQPWKTWEIFLQFLLHENLCMWRGFAFF